jgi:hypothetical protein
MMRRFLLPVVTVVLGVLACGPNLALASDKRGGDKERLLREIDRRMDAKFKKFRSDLMRDLKKLLAHRGKVEKRVVAKLEVPHKKRSGVYVLKGKGSPRIMLRVEKDGKEFSPEGFTWPYKEFGKAKPFKGFEGKMTEFGKKFAEKFKHFDFGRFSDKAGKKGGIRRMIEQLLGEFEGGKGKGFFGMKPGSKKGYCPFCGRGGEEGHKGPHKAQKKVQLRFKVDQKSQKAEHRSQLRFKVDPKGKKRTVILGKRGQSRKAHGSQAYEELRREKDRLAREIKELIKLLEKIRKKSHGSPAKDESEDF